MPSESKSCAATVSVPLPAELIFVGTLVLTALALRVHVSAALASEAAVFAVWVVVSSLPLSSETDSLVEVTA